MIILAWFCLLFFGQMAIIGSYFMARENGFEKNMTVVYQVLFCLSLAYLISHYTGAF